VLRATVTLRPACEADARQLWQWRNEESMRLASFQTAPVPFADHEAWVSRVLTDRSVLLLIGIDDAQQGIGYIRFNLDTERADVSVCVDSRQRGRGLGVDLINTGCAYLWERHPSVEVVALVKQQNSASRAAFLAAGFRSMDARHDGEQIIYELRRRSDEQVKTT